MHFIQLYDLPYNFKLGPFERKLLLKMVKMLVTSIFYFSYHVFCPFKSKFHWIRLSSGNAFNSKKSSILSFYDFTKQQIYGLNQIQSICRQHTSIHSFYYDHFMSFLLFQQCFQRPSFTRSLKVLIVW